MDQKYQLLKRKQSVITPSVLKSILVVSSFQQYSVLEVELEIMLRIISLIAQRYELDSLDNIDNLESGAKTDIVMLMLRSNIQ